MHRPRGIRSDLATKTVWWQDNEKRYEGTTRNLSMSGVYILAAAKPDIGSFIEIIIDLPGSNGQMQVYLPSTVVRHDGDGFAVTFGEIKEANLEHLKNLVAYQNAHPEEVLMQWHKKSS